MIILIIVQPKSSEYSILNGSIVHVTREVELMYDGDLIAFEIIHIKEAKEKLRKHNIKEQLYIFLSKFGLKRVSFAQAEFCSHRKSTLILPL